MSTPPRYNYTPLSDNSYQYLHNYNGNEASYHLQPATPFYPPNFNVPPPVVCSQDSYKDTLPSGSSCQVSSLNDNNEKSDITVDAQTPLNYNSQSSVSQDIPFKKSVDCYEWFGFGKNSNSGSICQERKQSRSKSKSPTGFLSSEKAEKSNSTWKHYQNKSEGFRRAKSKSFFVQNCSYERRESTCEKAKNNCSRFSSYSKSSSSSRTNVSKKCSSSRSSQSTRKFDSSERQLATKYSSHSLSIDGTTKATENKSKKLCSSRSSYSDKDSFSESSDEDALGDSLDLEKKEGHNSSNEDCKTRQPSWIRSAPAEMYYYKDDKHPSVVRATNKLKVLCEKFEDKLIKLPQQIRNEKNKIVADNAWLTEISCASKNAEGRAIEKNVSSPAEQICSPSDDSSQCCSSLGNTNNSIRKKKKKRKNCCTSKSSSCDDDTCSNNSSNSDDEDDDDDYGASHAMEELEKKKKHPLRLHEELWYNDSGQMNDGPLCRCSLKARRSGIRHGFYVGEKVISPCVSWSNNVDALYHYVITISPPTNFLVKTPTIIYFDSHEFIFEGFSLFSHAPLVDIPICKVIRFNIQYSIHFVEEKAPENFCMKECDLFFEYLFKEVLELVDWDLHPLDNKETCPCFHFMPRFVRALPDNGKEILSMNEVLNYLLNCYKLLVVPEDLSTLIDMSQNEWEDFVDKVKGMIVTCPGVKPCSIRVDQIDRDHIRSESDGYPIIVHFGIRPPQLSYAGNPEYQRAWKDYVKFRHLLANMPKPSSKDKMQLALKETRLQSMRMSSKMKRDVTVAISSQNFYITGIVCDIVQHAMLLPVLVCHLRFHQSLENLEKNINYKFFNRFLLQLALTHPSYRENFGTNPDHARNSLTNCGIRQPEYGDRRIHYKNTRKRGIKTLINIMSLFGKKSESESKITHNERLEFLGDAVVEFLASIHLFHLFHDLEEGGLATYRAAIVQNQHLAVLAEKLSLDCYMLYAHGSDLCHDFELRHAMANCFEALMGAIFLDSNIEVADAVFSKTLFKSEGVLHDIWVNYGPHPLQQDSEGDRKCIETFLVLQKLVNFEEAIGIQFKHIRLLARAFTDRSIGYNNLTLGSNQRLEFLGDTVLQLIASEYLYKHYPEHHEGHLSLLRSSLVNNRTQAVVCDDLGMTTYAMHSSLKTELKTKDRADLLEAFLGALYLDRGLEHCRTFCEVCFFPRLYHFIMNQDWNDPKSKLQQCCLTLRTMEGGEPDIPVYKVIECKGPTNTRVYTVAVYFRNKRLAKASGHSIQQAEMNAAKDALFHSKDFFPQLDHQRKVIEKSVKFQKERQYEQGLNLPENLENIKISYAWDNTLEKTLRKDRRKRPKN